MRLRVLPALAVALSFALGGSASAGQTAGRDVKAKAKFTVRYGDEKAKFDFGQSTIVKSQLGATPQVPVSLHASPEDDPVEELVLAGRAKKGRQKTSEAVVLSITVSVGERSFFLISDDGSCTVKVKTLTDSRIAGSFTCDTTYGDDPLKAKGTFKAR